MSYKQVDTHKKIFWLELDAGEWNPVATLEDGGGERAHILKDDNCYVLALKTGEADGVDRCVSANHWPLGAVEVLRLLPSDNRDEWQVRVGGDGGVDHEMVDLMESKLGVAEAVRSQEKLAEAAAHMYAAGQMFKGELNPESALALEMIRKLSGYCKALSFELWHHLRTLSGHVWANIEAKVETMDAEDAKRMREYLKGLDKGADKAE